MVRYTKAEIEEFCDEDGPVTVLLTLPCKSSMEHVLQCAKNEYNSINFEYITENNAGQPPKQASAGSTSPNEKISEALTAMANQQAEMQSTMQAFLSEVTKWQSNSKVSIGPSVSSKQITNQAKMNYVPKKVELSKEMSCLTRITTAQEMIAFEQNLGNANFMQQAIKECYSLGWTIKDTGNVLGYRLLDTLFPKVFIASQCSWSGNGKVAKKIPFCNFHNIHDLFTRSIQRVHKKFNKAQCVEFFKNVVFKHSSRRAKRALTATETAHSVKRELNEDDVANETKKKLRNYGGVDTTKEIGSYKPAEHGETSATAIVSLERGKQVDGCTEVKTQPPAAYFGNKGFFSDSDNSDDE